MLFSAMAMCMDARANTLAKALRRGSMVLFQDRDVLSFCLKIPRSIGKEESIGLRSNSFGQPWPTRRQLLQGWYLSSYVSFRSSAPKALEGSPQ
jgi:hypothetical protein